MEHATHLDTTSTGAPTQNIPPPLDLGLDRSGFRILMASLEFDALSSALRILADALTVRSGFRPRENTSSRGQFVFLNKKLGIQTHELEWFFCAAYENRRPDDGARHVEVRKLAYLIRTHLKEGSRKLGVVGRIFRWVVGRSVLEVAGDDSGVAISVYGSLGVPDREW